MTKYLSAQEAAAQLGIKTATLYAYVSRGLIRSEQVGGPTRDRRYLAEDVRQQQQKQTQRRNPAHAVEQALHWGMPVLESALTRIADDGLYYRGQNAIALAQTHSFEQVAALLWGMAQPLQMPMPARTSDDAAVLRQVRGLNQSFMPAFQIALALAATTDPTAYDTRPANVQRMGARIIGLLAQVAGARLHPNRTLAEALAIGWQLKHPQAGALINSALVLCADHELNASAFTARCAASTNASPYGAVLAGLAALQGPKHGGHTARVATLLNECNKLRTPAAARRILAARLQRGEPLPGFGHTLYAEGDPRGAALLAQLAETLPRHPALARSQALVSAVERLTGDRPTIDFALVALALTLALPEGAALALFALGRTAGWVGHALEQYASGEMIRPRAKYVGV